MEAPQTCVLVVVLSSRLLSSINLASLLDYEITLCLVIILVLQHFFLPLIKLIACGNS